MSSSIGSVPQTRPTASTPTTPNLEGLARGSRGPDVMELQKQLNARGAALECDGKFGPLTEAALKKFQADSGCSGAGRVDAGTVTALGKPPAATPAATTPAPTTAPTAKPTADIQAGARARCAADEGRVRAQMAPVPTKPAAATSTTTPATTTAPATAPEGQAITPEQVTTVLSNIDAGKKQVAQEKAVLGQVQEALQREVKSLETPAAGTTPSVADQAVLAGRKGQLEAVTKANEVLDLKTKGYDAVATAVKDGVLTQTEADSLVAVDGAVKKSEAAVTSHFQASSSLVDKGLKAGGRGSPSLGLKKPEAPAAGTTPATTTPTTPATTTPTTTTPAATPPAGKAIAAADLTAAQQKIAQATAGTRAEQQTVATAKATIEAQVKTLQALPNRTVADDAVLAGRQAQLQVIGKAQEHLDIRLKALDASTRALSDGILTDDETKNLGAIDQSLSAAEQQLAAQASLATDLVNRGIAAGGRSGT